MALQALRDPFRARCSGLGAFTDRDQLSAEDTPVAAAVGPKIFSDYDTSRAAIVERRSAVRWANRIGAPLLIMHGSDDTRVSPTHALPLAAALLAGANRMSLRSLPAHGTHPGAVRSRT